jgi:hypothetical protein
MEFYTDLFSRLKAAQGKPVNSAAPAGSSAGRVISLGDALEEACPEGSKRAKIFNTILEPVITKLVRSTDIATLRMATLVDRVAELRNDETPFLNWLETQPMGVEPVNDYQIRFDEWNKGQDLAEPFNIEDSIGEEAKSQRATRNNTLTCVGNKIAVSLITQEFASQQRGVDMMGRELDFEVGRIRRAMNRMLLSNTEVKMESAGNIPQLGGLVTRSTAYGVSAGGSDLTRLLIQGRIDAIANDLNEEGMGFGVPLVGFTNHRQIGVLRDIIISEYNGIDPVSRMQFEANLMSRLQTARISDGMVFEPNNNSSPILFVKDSQLPAGVTILFDSRQPQLAKMPLGGQYGPYALQRPTEKLQTLNTMFDLFSLIDPIILSRAVISGVLS